MMSPRGSVRTGSWPGWAGELSASAGPVGGKDSGTVEILSEPTMSFQIRCFTFWNLFQFLDLTENKIVTRLRREGKTQKHQNSTNEPTM